MKAVKQSIFSVVGLLIFPCICFAGAGTFMATYIGMDSPGKDYDVIETTDVEVCKNACNSDSKCAAFTLNKTLERCWLKTDALEMMNISTPDAENVVFGVKAIKYIDNIDRMGMDYRSTEIFDVNMCSHICFVSKTCKAFTYNKNSKMCNLKNGVPAPVTEAAGLSGVK